MLKHMKTRKLKVSLRCHETWLLCWHEKHIQSVPVLWCKDLSFWSKTQTVRKMSKNVENPNKEARSACPETPFCFGRTNLSTTADSQWVESASLSHASSIELPISKSSAEISSEKVYSEISQGSIDPLDRWNMVFLQESTVDSPSGRSQTHQRSLRSLLGSFASQGCRKPGRMVAIYRNDSAQRQKTHLRRRVRQFSWRQKTRSEKSLDPSTVSFPFNPSIPIKKRTLEAWDWASKGSRINLSAGSSVLGVTSWKTTFSYSTSLKDCSTPSANSSTPHAHSRILEKHQLLSKLSNTSVVESSFNHQHYRIDESINPRSDAPMWQSTNSRIPSALDKSFYTYAT